MYTALYRRFRPETLDQMLGQEHIVKILKNQINSGQTGHAYLFCGTRGTGKTTMARILAKGVNCLSTGEKPCGTCEACTAIRDGVFVDVIEIDAASNNGVENIRELRESVKYPPTAGRVKVYIIDEVHMLSTGAFNALLKTLEEPPENVMFVLATTEPQKLPATILSRCLRLDFKRVSAPVIQAGMRTICDTLGVSIDAGALALLSANADGSVRDGLSLLDQCVSAADGNVTRDTVLDILGSPAEEQLIRLTELVYQQDVAGALVYLDQLLANGKDERQLMRDWLEHFRNLLLLNYVKNPQDMMNMSVEHIEQLQAQSKTVAPDFVENSIYALAKTQNDARWSNHPRILLEVCLIRMAQPEVDPGEREETPRAKAVRGSGRAQTAKELPEAELVQSPQERQASQKHQPSLVQPEVEVQPEAHQEQPPPQLDTEIDVEATWEQTLDEIGAQNGLLSRLKGRSRILEFSKGRAVVEVDDEITKRTAESAREQLEAALQKRVNGGCRLEYVLRKKEESAIADAQDLARQIEQKLNISVELE